MGGNGAAVNVNAIPLAAIKGVEVLKDAPGACMAPMRSPAFVTSHPDQEFPGHPTGGHRSIPDRAEVAAAASVRRSSQASRWAASSTLRCLRHLKRKALYARDRSFAKTGNVLYLVAAATGQGNIQGTYTRARDTNGVPDRRRLAWARLRQPDAQLRQPASLLPSQPRGGEYVQRRPSLPRGAVLSVRV